MSAPDTNIDRQEKQHKPSLFGVRGSLIAVVLIVAALIAYNVMKPEGSGETVTQEPAASTVETDTYAPGTNSSETPADPAATGTATD